MTSSFPSLRRILDHAIEDLEQCVDDFEKHSRLDDKFKTNEVGEKARETLDFLSKYVERLRRITRA